MYVGVMPWMISRCGSRQLVVAGADDLAVRGRANQEAGHAMAVDVVGTVLRIVLHDEIAL